MMAVYIFCDKVTLYIGYIQLSLFFANSFNDLIFENLRTICKVSIDMDNICYLYIVIAHESPLYEVVFGLKFMVNCGWIDTCCLLVLIPSEFDDWNEFWRHCLFVCRQV